MKVYRVRPHISVFQWLELKNKQQYGDTLIKTISFDGRRRGTDWKPLEFFVLYPMLEIPDFWTLFIPNAFAVTRELDKKLWRWLSEAGELLPIGVDGREMLLLNITKCASALDKEKSVFRSSGLPNQYGFHRERIPCCLFKIPETAGGEILCAEWEGNPEKEFKAAVELQKLRGFRFKLLWDSDAPPSVN